MDFGINAVRYYVVVSSEAFGFFSSSTGLHQGDAVSRLLLILVMETLTRLVNKAIDMGFLEGFQVTNAWSKSMLIFYLLFVDDTLFFCKPYASNCYYLKQYEAMSGLRVNLAKNVLIPIGEVPNLHHLVTFFGYKVDFLHASYLDLPLGASYKCKTV